EIWNRIGPARRRPVVPELPERAADRTAGQERQQARGVSPADVSEPRRPAATVVQGLEEKRPADPNERHQPHGHEGERQDDAHYPGGGGEPERSRRRAPRRHAGTGEERRPQGGRGKKQRGKDRREGPVVADAPQEEVRLEVVVLPPEPYRVDATAPETRGVVELEEPPAPDRRKRDEHAFDPVGRQVRAEGETRDQGVHEQDVPGPHDRREPAGHRRLPPDEEQ